MRSCLLMMMCLLAGCSQATLSDHSPGLEVARAALASGAPDIALRVTAEKLRQSPDNAAALLLQGQSFALQGKNQEAAEAFRRVLVLQPASMEAQLGLGRLALASDPPAAELLFLQVLAQAPRNAIALNDVGIARDLQNRHTQAQNDYREALGVAPDMQAAMVNLAMSLALSGQADRGRDLLRPLATAPDASARVRHDFGLVSAIAGDRVAAEKALSPDMSRQDLQDALKSYEALSAPPQAAHGD